MEIKLKRILLCDDHLDVRESVKLLIEIEFDVEIVEASNGKEAIDIISQDPLFDLIVSDVHMPIKSGIDVLNCNIRSLKIPQILLSGSADDCEVIPEKINSIKYQFLSKPWDPGELLNTISSFLEIEKAA